MTTLQDTPLLPPPEIRFAAIEDVRPADDFLGSRIRTNRAASIPHILQKVHEVGIVDNFRRAAGLKEGDYVGLHNADEFLYKTIEAGAYALRREYDAELDRALDEIIAAIAAAQEPDGYLRTPHTIHWVRGGATPRAPRWSKLNGDLELYSLGHLIEAAVAHHAATGKRNLLDVAIKAADLVDRLFGVGKKIRGVDMIPEIELALIRLHEVTGEARYLKLAHYFTEERGDASGHPLMGEFSLDHRPLREQPEAVGHATFAVYLYSGAADLVRHRVDTSYVPALHRLWRDLVCTKMSINGGLGSKHENEGFSTAYDIPNLTAYNEICAGVGFVLHNQRMFRIDPDAKYFDVAERTLYNNVLSGVSQNGRKFFYVCPTESDAKYKFNLGWCPSEYHGPYCERVATRKEWIPCACCPPTLARLLPQIPALAYAVADTDVYVNLYLSGEARLRARSSDVRIAVQTDYPWNEKIALELQPAFATRFSLRLRIPAWLDAEPIHGDLYRFADAKRVEAGVRINGQRVEPRREKGFAVIEREWQPGDRVELILPMEIRRVVSHPNVAANAGRVALQRGPILYCAEAVDNGGSALDIRLPDTAELRSEFRPNLLGGAPVLTGPVFKRSSDGSRQSHPLTAIPYALWSNRGENEMIVWFHRD